MSSLLPLLLSLRIFKANSRPLFVPHIRGQQAVAVTAVTTAVTPSEHSFFFPAEKENNLSSSSPSDTRSNSSSLVPLVNTIMADGQQPSVNLQPPSPNPTDNSMEEDVPLNAVGAGMREPPKVGPFDMSEDAAKKNDMTFSDYISYVLHQLTGALALCNWGINTPRALHWILLVLRPAKLVERLRLDIFKLPHQVIPDWDWLHEWFTRNLASAEQQPYFSAMGQLLDIRNQHFATLESLVTHVSDLRRTIPGNEDKFWVHVILHNLPTQMRNLLLFRPDGNRNTEWVHYDDFLHALRLNAQMYRPVRIGGAPGAGPSNSQPTSTSASKKRPATSSPTTTPKKKDSFPVASPVRARQLPDSIPMSARYPDHAEGRKLYIKNMTEKRSRWLKQHRKCLLCEGSHMLSQCDKKSAKYAAGDYFYY